MTHSSLVFQIAIIVAISIAANCHGGVTALDVPNPNIQANKFDYTKSFRQNMCSYQEAYDNSSVDLRNALNGASLNVAIGFDPDFVNLQDDTTSALDPTDPGLMIDLLDEVASRGGFTWRDSFMLEGNPYTDEEGISYEQEKDWSDLLQWSTETYDVSARWWLNIPSRIAEGASFPKGWYDSNLIIIAKKDQDTFFEGSVFRPFSWGAPFTSGVWLSLFFTLIITGISFGYIENKKLLQKGGGATTTNTNRNSSASTTSDSYQESKGRRYLNATFSHIHESFIVFTGHLDLSPRTNSGRLVSFSLSLFAMLMVLTYGANLASFLVIQRAAFLTKIDTVNDIVRMSKSMCVYQDTATFEVISNVYSNAIIVNKQSEKETLLGLKAGDCNYAILGQSAWDTYERIEEVNSGCPLVQIGRVFKRYESGFAMRSDASVKCTSIVRNVFNLHLQEMYDTGFIDKAWEEHVNKKQDMIDPSCLPGVGGADESMNGVETLDLTNLGGIFMFHFVFLLIAFFFSATGTGLEPLQRNSSKDSSESNFADAVSHAFEPNHIDGNSDITGISESHHMDVISRTVEEHSLMLQEISTLLRDLNKKVGADNVPPHSRSRITSDDEESNQRQSNRILQVFCPPGDSTQD